MTLEKYKAKKKFGILIAVRSDSRRLPGKHFKIINEKLKIYFYAPQIIRMMMFLKNVVKKIILRYLEEVKITF